MLTRATLLFPAAVAAAAPALAAPEPNRSLPAPSGSLPIAASLPRRLVPGSPEAGRPFAGADVLRLTGTFLPGEPAAPTDSGFSRRLRSRMVLEAGRYRRDNVSEARVDPALDLLGAADTAAEARRSAEASRIITRSVRRVLDEELERVARTSLGLGPVLDALGGVPLFRSASRAPGASSERGAPRAPSRADMDFGMRLDAHPALVLRAAMPGLRGRLELPVRAEPVRLTVESPLGRKGRAVLSSGLPRDGRPYATLTLNFSF